MRTKLRNRDFSMVKASLLAALIVIAALLSGHGNSTQHAAGDIPGTIVKDS